MMNIKSALKVFGELTNVARTWANSHINLAKLINLVQMDIDVWQFVWVGMRNYRDRNSPLLIPIMIVETKN